MTDEERATVRTAYRPFMEALMGRASSVSQEEWAAAVDRIFPPSEPATSDSDVGRETGLDFTLIGSTILHLKQRIDYRLNDHLCEMKPGYDDSITGFNAAWDVVREIFKEATDNLQANMPTSPVYEAPRDLSIPLLVRGVGRDAGEPRSLSVALTERPTDDDIRSLHEFLRGWEP